MGIRETPEILAAIEAARQEGRILADSAGTNVPPLAPTPAYWTWTEKHFMAEVQALAKRLGWRVYHVGDSRRSEPGFPDLVLVRERVVWAELKDENNKPTAAQKEWLKALREAGEEVYLWRPSDWPEIQERLR